MAKISWKRPENVPFPSVWSRFEGKKSIDGKIPKFWIQDIPEDMFDEAAEVMCNNFIPNEPLCKFSNVLDDDESVKELRALWKTLAEQKLGLICFMEKLNGEKVIAGVNMTYPSVKGDPLPTFQGKKWSRVLEIVMYVCCKKDPYEMLGINEYLNARGLAVPPEFRGQGIGEALLLARTPLCKAVGLKATCTLFTAAASQALAIRAGFEDIVNMSYVDLEKINPRFKYEGITGHTKNIRYMYKLIS